VRWGAHEPITRHQVPTLWRRHNLVFKWWICHLRRHMGLGFGIHDHAHESIMGIQGIKMFYQCYIFRYITFHVNYTFENLIASRYNTNHMSKALKPIPNIHVQLDFLHCSIYMCPFKFPWPCIPAFTWCREINELLDQKKNQNLCRDVCCNNE
jgi:hypothetical protein